MLPSDGVVRNWGTGRGTKPHTPSIIVLLFYCGVQSKHGKNSREERKGVVTLPPPPLAEKALNSVRSVGCSTAMYDDSILQTSISERGCQHNYVCSRILVYCCTFTPCGGNIYKHMPRAFKRIYSICHVATVLAKKAMSWEVTLV
jgi:hypothetical protein